MFMSQDNPTFQDVEERLRVLPVDPAILTTKAARREVQEQNNTRFHDSIALAGRIGNVAEQTIAFTRIAEEYSARGETGDNTRALALLERACQNDPHNETVLAMILRIAAARQDSELLGKYREAVISTGNEELIGVLRENSTRNIKVKDFRPITLADVQNRLQVRGPQYRDGQGELGAEKWNNARLEAAAEVADLIEVSTWRAEGFAMVAAEYIARGEEGDGLRARALLKRACVSDPCNAEAMCMMVRIASARGEAALLIKGILENGNRDLMLNFVGVLSADPETDIKTFMDILAVTRDQLSRNPNREIFAEDTRTLAALLDTKATNEGIHSLILEEIIEDWQRERGSNIGVYTGTGVWDNALRYGEDGVQPVDGTAASGPVGRRDMPHRA